MQRRKSNIGDGLHGNISAWALVDTFGAVWLAVSKSRIKSYISPEGLVRGIVRIIVDPAL